MRTRHKKEAVQKQKLRQPYFFVFMQQFLASNSILLVEPLF